MAEHDVITETSNLADSSKPTVEITSLQLSETAPVTKDELRKLIREFYLEKKEIASVIEQLGKKSSKYKFIGQITLIDGSDVTANADYSALWDSDKDGCISVKVVESEKRVVLITVFWVFVD